MSKNDSDKIEETGNEDFEEEEEEGEEENEERSLDDEELYSEKEIRSDHIDGAKVRSPIESEGPAILTKEEAGKSLCLLGKTANGLEYAYLMIKANYKRLVDIQVITSFRNILFVDVTGNQLRAEHLNCLSGVEFLLMIKADENLLITPQIVPMRYLQILSLNKNEIVTTEGVNHPLLECLELNYNQIGEVVGLDPLVLKCLKTLELRGNALTTTRGIHLETLERLYLAENLIENLEGLENLVNLQIFHLRENPLKNLDGFSAKMKSLKYLNMRRCRIEEVAELIKLSCLINLEILVVSENPFSEMEEEDYRIEVLVHNPKLKRIDKVAVQEEELEEAEQIREERKEEEMGESREEEDTDSED